MGQGKKKKCPHLTEDPLYSQAGPENSNYSLFLPWWDNTVLFRYFSPTQHRRYCTTKSTRISPLDAHDEMAIDLNALQRWLAQWYWFLDKMINIMNKKNLRELLGIHTNSPLYPGQACGLCDQSKQDPSN